MGKDLSRMTNEELWQLFPVILCPYDPSWEVGYERGKAAVEKAIGKQNILRVNHIGSTAVPGLLSKPTIDILVEVTESCDTEKLIRSMTESGYIYSPQPENPAPHMMFLKGYTPEGFKGQAYHIHVRYLSDWGELYFRDYLRDHGEAAAGYAALKSKLCGMFRHDRDAYTDAKSDFINKNTELARGQYKGRYEPPSCKEGADGR